MLQAVIDGTQLGSKALETIAEAGGQLVGRKERELGE